LARPCQRSSFGCRIRSGYRSGWIPQMTANLAVNRTRRLMSSTWRASARRAGYLGR
jgi:hypothetical protein